MNISKAIEGFTLSKSADGLSPATLEIYKWGLDKLIAFRGDVELESVTVDDLRRWMVWLRDEYKPKGYHPAEHLSPASLQDAWRALKSFYAWAERDLHIARVDDIKRPAGSSPQVVPLTDDEVRKLLKCAERFTYTLDGREITARRPTGIRNVAIILTLLDTGMRVGELCRLTVSDANLATGEIAICPFGTGRKTAGRMVYLGKVARKAVWRYLSMREVEPGEPLFLTDDKKAMGTNTVLLVLLAIGKSAGVANVHPHRFRHTFAIQSLRNGMSVFVLQKLLGHSSLEMVRHYLKLVNTDLSAAMMSASPADRWKL